MSQENVERLRPVYREWAKGNWRAGAELFDPEIVLTSAVPEGDVVSHGINGIASFMGDFLAQWARYTVEADEFIDCGDKVLVVGRQRGVAKTTGLKIEIPVYNIWTFREDRVVALRFAIDHAQALEAAGLRG